MTTVIRPTRPPYSAPRALWFAVLALLLAVQSATGLSWDSQRSDDSAQTLRMVAAVPPAAQFRDAGKVVQAGSRALAPKLRGHSHDDGPGLPGQSIVLATANWDAPRLVTPREAAPRIYRPGARYHARAPPQAG